MHERGVLVTHSGTTYYKRGKHTTDYADIIHRLHVNPERTVGRAVKKV